MARRALLALALLAAAAACSSSGGRGRPVVTESWTFQLTGGVPVAVTDRCDGLAPRGLIEDELRAAEGRIRRETGATEARCLAGMTVVITPDVATGHAHGVEQGYVAVGCGLGALEHEPGHFCAWRLNRPDWRTMWHDGRTFR